MKPEAINPHWIGDYPAWDVRLTNGDVHKDVTRKEIYAAIVALKRKMPAAVKLYDDCFDVVRQTHINLYDQYNTL